MIQYLNNFEVLTVQQRENHVPGAETGMHTALHRIDAEGIGDPPSSGYEAVGFTGI
ncbi:hypothetical protein GCM10009582_17550 [Arthrobacter flavus]